MRYGISAAFLTAAMFFVSVSAYAQSIGTGTWVNQGNSVLTITDVAASGGFLGTYVNGQVESFPCATTNDIFSVEGQALSADDGSVYVTFAVNWTNPDTNCGTVTRWSGFMDTATQVMQTNWVLASDGSTVSLLGTDTFEPSP